MGSFYCWFTKWREQLDSFCLGGAVFETVWAYGSHRLPYEICWGQMTQWCHQEALRFTRCNQLDSGGMLELHGLSHNNAIILEGKCFRPQLQLTNDVLPFMKWEIAFTSWLLPRWDFCCCYVTCHPFPVSSVGFQWFFLNLILSLTDSAQTSPLAQWCLQCVLTSRCEFMWSSLDPHILWTILCHLKSALFMTAS